MAGPPHAAARNRRSLRTHLVRAAVQHRTQGSLFGKTIVSLTRAGHLLPFHKFRCGVDLRQGVAGTCTATITAHTPPQPSLQALYLGSA